MPCHSPTPKSASKSSVSVYQGTSKPVRALPALDVGLRRPGDVRERGVAGVQVRRVGVLGGHHRAAAAAPLRPAADARLEEVAVDDQLAAALEQVEEADRAVRPLEAVVLLHGHPRHAAALGGQRVAGAGVRLLLDEHLLPARPATPAGRRSAAGSSGGAAAGELTGDALVRERCGDDGEIEHGGAPFVWLSPRRRSPDRDLDSRQRKVPRRRSSSARSTALAVSAIARSYARAAAPASPARLSSSACAACSGW